jgi:hypothetical protein
MSLGSTMRAMSKSVLLLVVAIIASACDSDAITCTDVPRPALLVHVEDSASGLPLNAGATVVARDGAYRDSVTRVVSDAASNAFGFTLANGRSGTYELTVRRDGYAEWRRTIVATTSDACGPTGTNVLARLQP